MALALGEEPQGFRHIEQLSGITDDSLLKVLPEAGTTTTLLRCPNRGKFAYEETERQQINLSLRRYSRPVTSAGHHWFNSLSLSSYVQDVKDVEDEKDVDVEDESTEREVLSGVRQMSLLGKDALDLLDPSLDIWKNPTEGYAERQEFGDAGWALAVVTGMKRTLLAPDEISRIIRVGDRQVRRVVDKLVKWGWAQRVRQGRRVLVAVDFSLMAHEDLRDDYLKHVRRARKALVAQFEQSAVKRLGTRTGRMIRDLWRERVVQARMIREMAEGEPHLRCWDGLLAILSRKSRREDFRNGLTRWEAEHLLYENLKPYLREDPALTA